MTTATEPDAPAVRTRETVQADLLSIFRIEKASFAQPWPFRAFERFLGTPGFLVADTNEVVGYVVADDVPNHGRRLGHVKDIAVSPHHRGRGIGATLLDRALAVMRERGVTTVKLEVRESNATARSLYRRFGFTHRKTAPGYYADGENALILVCDLDS